MQVENIHTQEKHVGVIEHNGRGRFRADKDLVVQVSALLGTTYYIFQPLTIETIPFYKSLDLNNAEVLEKTPSVAPVQPTIASFDMPQSYFRQFNVGHDQSSLNLRNEKYVKYGLPSNIGLVEKKGYVFTITMYYAYQTGWLTGSWARVRI